MASHPYTTRPTSDIGVGSLVFAHQGDGSRLCLKVSEPGAASAGADRTGFLVLDPLADADGQTAPYIAEVSGVVLSMGRKWTISPKLSAARISVGQNQPEPVGSLYYDTDGGHFLSCHSLHDPGVVKFVELRTVVTHHEGVAGSATVFRSWSLHIRDRLGIVHLMDFDAGG
jgi:hypothetical protein